MRISSRLSLANGIVLGALCFMILTVSWTFHEADNVRKSELVITDIEAALVQMSVLQNEYLLRVESRAKTQWESKVEYIKKLLEQSKFRFTDIHEHAIFDEIEEKLDLSIFLFSSITKYYISNENVEKRFSSLESQRLFSQIIVNGYNLNSATQRLHESVRLRLKTTQKTTTTIIILLMVLSALITVANSFAINRTLSKRIAVLSKGAKLIGDGNIDHQISLEGSDELTALARTHNEMASKLKNSYTSLENLEKEIAEREKAEQASRESNERFMTIFEQAPLGIALIDSITGHIYEVNAKFAAIVGRTKAEMSQIDWMGITHPDDVQEDLDNMALLNTGKITGFDMDKRYIRPDGSIVWIHMVIAPILQTDQLHPCHLCMIEDITEWKRADAERLASQVLLNETGKLAKVGGWEFDVQTMELKWTKEVYHIHEVDITTYKPSVEKAVNFYAPASKPIIEQAVRRVIEQGEPFDLELGIITAKGNPRWVHAVGKLDQDQGKNKTVKGIFQDITKRKQAEDELRKSNELFSLFMHHSPVYTYIKEVTPGRSLVLQASDNYRYMIGIPGTEMVGKTMDELFPPEFADKITTDDWAVVSRGDVLKLDEELNGRSYTTIKFPVIQGERALLAGYTIDITERNRAEEEKARLEAQLQQSQKMESVGRLAGGVAHDFNNMLGLILGHAEMALDHVDPALPIHADLQEIIKAAERSADLTRQLLAFARQQTVQPKVLDLNEIVGNMLKMLQRLIGEDIDLKWQSAADLWSIKMDPTQIDQILANMCINARDAISDTGNITIETGNTSLDEAYCADHVGFSPGDYVKLIVSDDGCGMKKETAEHIFEPFFTTKGMGKGTGLGLSTVYGIVRQNNGFINVYSEPGQGTTFTVYFPRHIGKDEKEQTKPQEQKTLMRGQETLLLVEDEPALLELNKMILEKQGYRVLATGSPNEAIRLVGEYTGEISLLMTDVVMPEMNGRDLAKHLMTINPHLKCLFTSGYTADVIAHHGVLDEGVYFIQKPFSRQDLAAKVREVLEQK